MSQNAASLSQLIAHLKVRFRFRQTILLKKIINENRHAIKATFLDKQYNDFQKFTQTLVCHFYVQGKKGFCPDWPRSFSPRHGELEREL